MYKIIDLPAYGADGTATVQALFPVGNGFKVKVAESRVNPDVTDFVAKIKADPAKLYVLLNAVGAGEFYGDNQNADYFAEKDLDRDSDLAGYRTFYNAGVFRNHQNKDKAKSFGKVIFASYNRVMRRVELVIEIDRALAKEFGHEDLLVKLDAGIPVAVSMGCFLPGTPVVLADGTEKAIERIRVGDHVLTHTGKVKEVTEVHERPYMGLAYTVFPAGKFRKAISASMEHPWLVVERNSFWQRNEDGRFVRNTQLQMADAVWKESAALTGDEFLVCPRPRSNGDKIHIAAAKLLGWFLAEGSLRKEDHGVEFNVNETDDFCAQIHAVCAELGLPSPSAHPREHASSAWSYVIYSKWLHELCFTYCGKLAHHKRLNRKVFDWSREARMAFLGAVIGADGYVSAGATYISSCNHRLVKQLKWLAASLGLVASIGKLLHKASAGFSRVDTTEWILRFSRAANHILAPFCSKIPDTYSDTTGGTGVAYMYDEFYLVSIDHIDTEPYVGTVHNFEVADDNSYVVSEFAVHNCRVKFDVCRICGHKSYKPDGSDRCVCMRTMMRQLMPDGRKVCVDNPDPVFFDISFVVIGADRTSYAMQKVASIFAQRDDMSKEASLRGLRSVLSEKLAARRKRADLIKDVPAMARKVSPALARVQPDMSFDRLYDMASRYNLPTLASSLGAGGMVLSPREYQTIVMIRIGRPKAAEDLYDSGEVFPHSGSATGSPAIVSGSNVSSSLLSDILDVVQSRSAFGDGLFDQISQGGLCPRHAVANNAYKRLISFPEKSVLPQLSAPYTGYRLGLMQNMPSLVGSLTRQNPALLSTLSAGGLQGDHTLGGGQRGELLSALPMAYLYGAYARGVDEHDDRLGDLEAYVEQNPTLAAAVLLGLLQLGELVRKAGI